MDAGRCWSLVWLTAILCVPGLVASVDGCYKYSDLASKYSLDYEAKDYPWDEVNAAMSQYPQLSKVLVVSSQVPTSGAPGGVYYQPVSVVCPSQRFMLKAFQYDGKQCYVVKPEVQQVRYTKCSDHYNRDCHYCSYSQGGVSKCDEEYEWRYVWAYCKPIYPIHPVHPPVYPVQPPVYPPVKPPVYPPHTPVKPPVYPIPPYSSKQLVRQDILYAKNTHPEPYPPQTGYYYGRRKRGVVPQYVGTIEQVTLYLPFQCSCKNYRC